MNIAILTNSQTEFPRTAFSVLVSLMGTLAIMISAVCMSNTAPDVALVMAMFAVATATFVIATVMLIAIIVGKSFITFREAMQKAIIIFLVASVAFGVCLYMGTL